MGVLKVKVGADWLPVSQGFDATPAGFVGAAQMAADQTIATAAGTVDLTGVSVTWNADPTHTYRTWLEIGAADMAAGAAAMEVAYIRDAAGGNKRVHGQNVAASQRGSFCMFIDESGLSGVQTRKASFFVNAGTVVIAASGAASVYAPRLMVEDITTVVPMSAAVATPWMTATLGNSWVNYDTVNYSAASYRRIGDMVQLKGMIANGSLTLPAFTLPVGFRPPKYHYIATVANNAIAVGRIGPGGDVTITVGSTAWVSLDNIAFSVTA